MSPGEWLDYFRLDIFFQHMHGTAQYEHVHNNTSNDDKPPPLPPFKPLPAVYAKRILYAWHSYKTAYSHLIQSFFTVQAGLNWNQNADIDIVKLPPSPNLNTNLIKNQFLRFSLAAC